MNDHGKQREQEANKKIWIGTAVFIVVLSVVIACILLFGSNVFDFPGISIGGGMAELRNVTELTLEEDTDLELISYGDSIYFYEGSSEQLVIKEYYRTKRHPLAEIGQTGNRVTVSGEKRNEWTLFGWSLDEGDRIEVYMPEGGKNSVETIAASVSSGKIRLKQLFEGKEITLKSKSGSISCEREVRAENIRLDASSGSIKTESLTGTVAANVRSGSIHIGRVRGTAEVTGSSGNIKMMDMEGDLTASVTSGSIHVDGIKGFVTAESNSGSVKVLGLSGGAKVISSSGSIRVEAEELSDDMHAQVTSGSIQIQIPPDSGFQFQAEVTSGGIHTDFDNHLQYDKDKRKAEGVIGENPQYEIRTKASSGSIWVTY